MSAVLKRRVFFVQIQLDSPLNIASGEDEWTDADVLRDYDENPFIPGTSLAGAMRAYIEKEKSEPCLMGYTVNDADGKMSSLFLSDLTFDEISATGVRDGVALDVNKVALTGSKYEIEILEMGANGHFFAELVVREGDNEAEMERELSIMFRGFQIGEIRLGHKKTRGFGKIKILTIASKVFDKNNYLEYAKAYDLAEWQNCPNEKKQWINAENAFSKMLHIEVPLYLKGGISIRQYAARKNEPDFVQLTNGKFPVIPGSSFAGALQHRMKLLLTELKENGAVFPESHTVKDITDRMFGFVDGDNACASDVIINESEIEGARALTIVRTGISRFEAAVKDGTLYKEKTYVDGKVTVKISVRRGKNPENTAWITGLLLLAVKDLANGFLAVGGQTAVGRGTFSMDAERAILIDGEEGKEEEFIANAARYLGIEG